jgi:hypothetical protein
MHDEFGSQGEKLFVKRIAMPSMRLKVASKDGQAEGDHYLDLSFCFVGCGASPN